MSMLGEALVFHLAHMAEMERHFDAETLELPSETQRMVQEVGAAADMQAVDFLPLCDERIESHFCHLGASLVGRRSRKKIRENWGCDAKFAFDSGEISCGALLTSPPHIKGLPAEACGALLPWLWMKGGKRSEEHVWNAFKGKAHSRTGQGYVTTPGTIVLKLIPVVRNDPATFDVRRDLLLDQLSESLKMIGSKELKSLAQLARTQG